MKKYHRIIRRLETMADIQHQLQNIIQLAEVVNTQLAEIETTILQASNTYKTQMTGNIFSIVEELCHIIQGNMEMQAYHIQTFLANKLNRCKEKENAYANNYIKEIQDTHQNEYQEVKQLKTSDKEKQQENQVQDKEVLLYKLYKTLSEPSYPKIPEPIFVQDEINNLDKYMKFIQLLVQTIPFYPLPHYKSL